MSIRAPLPSFGPFRWSIDVLFAALMLSDCPALAEVAAQPCPGEQSTPVAVARVVDGRTFVLADGREVRLSGLEIPRASDDDADTDAGDRARAALEALIGGREVALRPANPATDRYGRAVAAVFVAPGGEWVQAGMIASGHALASARSGTASCMAELLRRERAARNAKLGLWEEPYYVIPRAEGHAAVAAERGRFTLVEGKVLSVRESGATIYVNFGRRWSEDFTVTIAKRNVRAFAAAGLEPNTLQGRVIRIRGWVEERGGPWIDARRPEQIEVVETDAK